MMEFHPMPKTPRLSREIVITEKIDGTNASVFIQSTPFTVFKEDGPLVAEVAGLFIYAGSRTRWITPEDDNYGFASWVRRNAEALTELGPGHHFGEWWGKGINRGYNGDERHFSLFNVGRWWDCHRPETPMPDGGENTPICCHVVPTLYRGPFDTRLVDESLLNLTAYGSVAAPGFMDPEGIMVYHTAANMVFKKTIKGDEQGKSFEGHVAKPPKVRAPKDPSKGGRRKEQLAYEGPDRRKT